MENKQLTLGSLFDGSGGFPLAGMLAGIIPVWASEVEPFPIRVTTKRLPSVKHYGDVSVLSGSELEPVDIITFGSPCQDLSVAGKRAGLEGERSGLFHEAVRIVKEMREKTHGEYPRYIVWENVPGAFSSNGGADFHEVLREVCSIAEEAVSLPEPETKWNKSGEIVGDGYSVAWRVLDAQYWGVPQRRARIFLVADFGGERAGDLLFVPESLCGNTAEGFEAWKRAAAGFEGGAGAAGCLCINTQGRSGVSVTEEVADTLIAQDHGNHPAVLEAAGFCTEHSAKARSIGYEEEKAPTLRAGVVPAAIALEHHPIDSRIGIDPNNTVQTLTNRMGTGGNNVPLVMTAEGPVAFGISSDQSHGMLSGNPHAGIYEAKTSRTLDLNGGHPGCNQGGIAVVEKAYPIEGNGQRPSHKGDGWNNSDQMYTLNQTEQHAVAAPLYHASKSSFFMSFKDDAATDTLVATDYKDPQIVVEDPYYIVRRLTPTECARLQGFPDWWCSGLGTDDPSDEEVAFWMDVFETHRKVITGAKKPKTEKQVRKWLSDPYLDSSAYRMYGNGVALPCVWFVLSAIVYSHQNPA